MCEQTQLEEAPMSYRLNNTKKIAPSRRYMPCPECGERLFMPEWSEHVDERRVRHCWQCDACDYAFEAIVSYGEAVAA